MIRDYRRYGWLAIFMAAAPLVGMADEPAAGSLRLDAITILGTRTEKAPAAVARSIDVIDADDIAHQQSSDIGSTIDALPNVSLNGSPRPAAESIRIRGLSGDRILLMVDGIRQGFGIGHLGQLFIDPGLIESVEVERGPASVLWGSGAVGGVVAVDTKDAADLLLPGQDVGVRYHGGYQSASDAWITSGAVYGHIGDHVDAMVHVGRASHEDLEQGGGDELANSAYRRTSVLAKSTVRLAPGQSLQLSHRRMRLDGVAPSNPSILVSPSNALMDREIAVDASRVEWQLTPASKWVDLTAGLSHSRTEVDELRLSGGRHDNTSAESIGVDVVNTSRFELGAAGHHALTYGVDGIRETIDARRNGQPRDSVPDATRLMAGVFVQDEIRWGDAWTATLGLRYDHYSSESDRGVAADHEDDSLSAQAGLLWQATDWLALYASYAEAFRAPSLNELYATGTHFLGNQFVANPDLKPEKAANKEVGVRTEWQGLFAPRDRMKFELTAFRNDVEDFIDLIVDVVPLPGPPFVGGTTRSANVTEARLEGYEATASYETDAWFVGLSYGQTRGENENTGEPLGDVAADTWVVRAGVTALPWDGRITWRMTHAEAQDRVPAGVQPTDSYTVHDLLTTWYLTDRLRIDAGIGNITDRDYRRHNSVLEEAGRSVKLGLTLKF